MKLTQKIKSVIHGHEQYKKLYNLLSFYYIGISKGVIQGNERKLYSVQSICMSNKISFDNRKEIYRGEDGHLINLKWWEIYYKSKEEVLQYDYKFFKL